MLTVEEIRTVAASAADGNRRSIALFRELCLAVGISGRSGGWIYLSTGKKPLAHGWQAAAKYFATAARLGWTGKDLLVEMSKRSATGDDIAAAEVEAHDDAAAYAQNAAHIEQARDARGMHMGPGHVAPATIATAYDEALAEDAHREALAIARSIPVDGRPAEVALMLEAAELLNDEHENLAALRAARARYDELTAAPADIVVTFDRIGARWTGPALILRLGPGLAADAEALGAAIRKHVRRHLASREFELWIDYDLGDVLIDGGRFGRGKIEGLPQVPCDCDGTHAPTPGGHSVACRKRETLYFVDRPTLDEQHDEALAMNRNPLKREPAPRAERLDAAFKRFVDLADTGGPGTSRGLIAAVEGATTVTESQLVRAFARANRSVSGDDAAGAVRYLLRELGFAVVAG